MKKLGLILVTLIVFVGCTKMEEYPRPDQITGTDLKIQSAVGIKLQSQFVTSEVAMNVKSDVAQTVTVKITDISNKVVSKSIMDVKAGDNILKVYTNAFPSSAYRIALYDAAGNQLGITDFNKL
jgi:uncharacterized protein YcfL